MSEIESYTGEKGTKFNAWLYTVDNLCVKTFGLGVFDLPDMAYRDEFEDGTRSTKMLAKIIDYNS